MPEGSAHEKLASELANRGGVEKEQASAVLDALGLKQQAGQLEETFGPGVLQQLSADNVRLSFRVGPSIVAL